MQGPTEEIVIMTVCTFLVLASFCGPYTIIWWMTGFKLGHAVDPAPLKPSWRPYNSWVVLWLTYGQVSTIFSVLNRLVLVGRIKKYGSLISWLAVAYAMGGVGMTIYGFTTIIRVMARDSICSVV